jgi:hypothetical protein
MSFITQKTKFNPIISSNTKLGPSAIMFNTMSIFVLLCGCQDAKSNIYTTVFQVKQSNGKREIV